MNAMSTRERFHAVMNFKSFDRLPLLEWAAWWDQTLARWHTEGLPRNLTDRYEICRHFGLDIYWQDWFPVRRAGCPQPAAHGAGIVASLADYQRLRPYLYPTVEELTDRWAQWAAWAGRQRQGQVVLWFTLEGFFWFPRTLLGIEGHLYAFYDQPELMHAINSDLAAWHTRIIEKVFSICTPDFMTFAEDMSYNHGPMLARELFDEFLKPYYALVVPQLKERGVFPLVDSDGDITIPAAWFADAGIEGLLPLERQAGVDIAALRQMYPAMRFIGHFDKMTMSRGADAMRREFQRLLPTAAKGGLLVSCDHQTPPEVAYRDYQLYLSLFRHYAAEIGPMKKA